MKPNSCIRLIGWLLLLIGVFSCRKEETFQLADDNLTEGAWHITKGHLHQTKELSSEVFTDWMNLYMDMLKTAGLGLNGMRVMSYVSIAGYESVVEGMPAHRSLYGQLEDMPEMPKINPGEAIHWGLSLNAAMAYMARMAMPNAAAFENSIYLLHKKWHGIYERGIPSDVLIRSQVYGHEVAKRIWAWAPSDGSGIDHGTFVPTPGVGYWSPTPPSYAPAIGPFWGRQRPFATANVASLRLPGPPAYSEDPSSAYYREMKEVYDVSLTLTAKEKEMALYYRDVPGLVAGTHYVSIMYIALKKTNWKLDDAVRLFAKGCMAIRDGMIHGWWEKYHYQRERPIRFIREVIGDADWLPLLNTPAHPDYPSGHSIGGGAMEEILADELGENFSLTNNTYDYLGMPPQYYSSTSDMAVQIGTSRIYAGIHYRISCEHGRMLGKNTAKNLLNTVRFRK